MQRIRCKHLKSQIPLPDPHESKNFEPPRNTQLSYLLPVVSVHSVVRSAQSCIGRAASFADAKTTEYLSQQIIAAEFAGDLAQGQLRQPQFLGE